MKAVSRFLSKVILLSAMVAGISGFLVGRMDFIIFAIFGIVLNFAMDKMEKK